MHGESDGADDGFEGFVVLNPGYIMQPLMS